ncbi:MAG: hypothetical protein Kow0069_03600 [Promethearchaeota archaeon]
MGNLVNEVIAYDALTAKDDSKGVEFFEDVFMFDEGTFSATIYQESGVRYKRVCLKGRRHLYEFEFLSLRLRKDIKFTPYMSRQKLVEEFWDELRTFSERIFTRTWITTSIRVRRASSNDT